MLLLGCLLNVSGRYRDGALDGFFPDGEFGDVPSGGGSGNARKLVVVAEGGEMYFDHDGESSWDDSETCPLPEAAMPAEEEECAYLACGEARALH